MKHPRCGSIPSGLASWIEISGEALEQNVSFFRSLVGGDEAGSGIGPGETTPPRLGAVLKSNAYGHGLLETLPIFHSLVDVLYVTAAEDALAIRVQEAKQDLDERRLVVMGAVSPEAVTWLAQNRVELVLSGDDISGIASLLRREALSLQVHVHVDTGLSREGYSKEELHSLASELLAKRDVLQARGVCSHFANVEDVTEQAYATSQLEGFEESAALLSTLLEKPLERHMAASAAAMVLPRARLDVVRAGISLYGMWPSPETRLSTRVVMGELPKLSPAMAWRCRPQLVKTIEAGSYVGYGCTYRAANSLRIAVLPVGYFDGYPRLMSGKAHVLIAGIRCPVVGRVMMNHIVVDATGTPECDTSSIVTLLGSSGGETLSAEVLAGWAQTINYEIVARVGPHLDRVLV